MKIRGQRSTIVNCPRFHAPPIQFWLFSILLQNYTCRGVFKVNHSSMKNVNHYSVRPQKLLYEEINSEFVFVNGLVLWWLVNRHKSCKKQKIDGCSLCTEFWFLIEDVKCVVNTLMTSAANFQAKYLIIHAQLRWFSISLHGHAWIGSMLVVK